jgi:hypothetical protein
MPLELPELEGFGFSFGCFGFFFSLRMSLFPMSASLVSGGWKGRLQVAAMRPWPH